MNADPPSADELASIKREIRESLDFVLEALLAKRWTEAANRTSLNEIYFKGTASPIEFLVEKANSAALGRTDLDVSISGIHDFKVEGNRADIHLRAAFSARRIIDGSPDGIVVDLKLRFLRSDAAGGAGACAPDWLISELRIDCPPSEHQWNNVKFKRAQS